jgi:hypothetical protein
VCREVAPRSDRSWRAEIARQRGRVSEVSVCEIETETETESARRSVNPLRVPSR